MVSICFLKQLGTNLEFMKIRGKFRIYSIFRFVSSQNYWCADINHLFRHTSLVSETSLGSDLCAETSVKLSKTSTDLFTGKKKIKYE